MSNSRRNFLKKSGFVGASLLASSQLAAAQHEGHGQQQPQAPPKRHTPYVSGGGIVPVETPDLAKLNWTMDNDVKVFHLTAEVVKTELVPGKEMYGWGYSGSVPGPMIEVNEGDRVRVVLLNKLPEPTTIHWHGLEVPLKMDGVPFISQPLVEPGGTFTYEFTATPHGSHMYHSHHNATDQVGRGMLGAFIVEPRDSAQRYQVDQDIIWISNDALGGFTINGKGFPATAPVVARLGQRVLIRFMNEGVMMHPWHLHGMPMRVVARDGYPLGTAAFTCDTIGVNPGERWDVIIDARNAGVWAFHCHILTHAEGHSGMFGMVTAMIVER